jgi:hypothetical protein
MIAKPVVPVLAGLVAMLLPVLADLVAVLLPILPHLVPVTPRLVRTGFASHPVAQGVPPVPDSGIGGELAGPAALVAEARQRARTIADAVGEARTERRPRTQGRQVRYARSAATNPRSSAQVRPRGR